MVSEKSLRKTKFILAVLISAPTLQAMRLTQPREQFLSLTADGGATALIKASGARGLSRNGDYAQTKRFLID
jgi:hypothetical protein